MNEIEYFPEEYLPRTNVKFLAPTYIVALVVESYYCDHISINKLAYRFQISEMTVSRILEVVLFNKPETPVVICLHSKV
jgi:hypothetical protein